MNAYVIHPLNDGLAYARAGVSFGHDVANYPTNLLHYGASSAIYSTYQAGSHLVSRVAGDIRSAVAAETTIPTIGGRIPVNSRYAGQIHPSGVSFTEQGFPDFTPYAKAQVGVDGLTGVYGADEALANAAVGLRSTPPGYVWHHVEDAYTMQLIPKTIHNAVRHTGGAAVIRNGGFDQ